MVFVHRDRVALDLIRISLPRHGGKLPLPDPTQQEAEVSTKQGSDPSPLDTTNRNQGKCLGTKPGVLQLDAGK